MGRKRKLDTKKYKKLLQTQHQELQQELKALADQTTGRDRLSKQVATEDFDEAGGDAATDAVERSQNLAIIDNLRDMLENVNEALLKITEGTYGVCEICAKNIPKKRLEALPYATMCTDCRARMGR